MSFQVTDHLHAHIQYSHEAFDSSARLAASHYEALIWESQQWYSRESYPSKFQSIRADIEDAVFKMTDNVKELIVRGLTCHLPISA